MSDKRTVPRTTRDWWPSFCVAVLATVLLSPVTVIWTAVIGSVALVATLLATRLRPAAAVVTVAD